MLRWLLTPNLSRLCPKKNYVGWARKLCCDFSLFLRQTVHTTGNLVGQLDSTQCCSASPVSMFLLIGSIFSVWSCICTILDITTLGEYKVKQKYFKVRLTRQWSRPKKSIYNFYPLTFRLERAETLNISEACLACHRIGSNTVHCVV